MEEYQNCYLKSISLPLACNLEKSWTTQKMTSPALRCIKLGEQAHHWFLSASVNSFPTVNCLSPSVLTGFWMCVTSRKHIHCQKSVKCVLCCCYWLSHVRLFATEAHQAPPSVGFFRQEYRSGLPFPPPGDLPDAGTEPSPPRSPALAGGFFILWASRQGRGRGKFRRKLLSSTNTSRNTSPPSHVAPYQRVRANYLSPLKSQVVSGPFWARRAILGHFRGGPWIEFQSRHKNQSFYGPLPSPTIAG